MPNKNHVDVFMNHMLPFRTRKSKNVSKMLNKISLVSVIISIILFRLVLQFGMVLLLNIWDLI